jgi:DNA processing protein
MGIESGIIDVDNEKYPKDSKEALKMLPLSLGAKKLYYKGNFDESIFKNCLAVVGSRRLTSYGRRATEQIVTECAAAGITIVSGFMYGGDEAAHSACVRAGGRTIAVMPCGVDVIFPPQQKELYNKILENKGLIISEYPEGFKPVNYSFVQRDRIVAGLAKAVFVTEASLNSGSLITAKYAKQMNKKIFALPGQIFSDVAKGTNKLIKEGAEIVSEPNDILSFYKVLVSEKIIKSAAPAGAAAENSLEQKIIDYLSRESMKADDMARIFAIPVSQLGTTLTMMQLKGIINLDNQKYYLN